MAATYSFSSPVHHVFAHKTCPRFSKPVRNKIVMLKETPIALKKQPTTTLQVRSSSLEKNKVFENLSEGVLCYIDDNGEIVCEGYDEGPRFHQNLSRTSSCNPRDAEIITMLQHRLLQIANGTEPNNPGNGMQEDLNWNGFNKFC